MATLEYEPIHLNMFNILKEEKDSYINWLPNEIINVILDNFKYNVVSNEGKITDIYRVLELATNEYIFMELYLLDSIYLLDNKFEHYEKVDNFSYHMLVDMNPSGGITIVSMLSQFRRHIYLTNPGKFLFRENDDKTVSLKINGKMITKFKLTKCYKNE